VSKNKEEKVENVEGVEKEVEQQLVAYKFFISTSSFFSSLSSFSSSSTFTILPPC